MVVFLISDIRGRSGCPKGYRYVHYYRSDKAN